MTTWHCNECDEYFDEDQMEIIREYHSELTGVGGILYEEFCVCPCCGSDDIEEYFEDEEEDEDED